MASRQAGRFLRTDGINRAWRTFMQGVGAVVLAAAGDAVLQVLQKALVQGATTHRFDWAEVGVTSLYTGGTAAVMALLAYLHRTRVDPSPIPSAQPPAPPAGVPATAVAMAPGPGQLP